MKICLINNLYKPYNRGGAETVVELIADGLKKVGHDIFIITTKPIFKKPETRNPKPGIHYIPSLFFNLNKIPKPLRFFWHLLDMFDIGSYLKVKSILKKEKPDVVMTHNLKGVNYLIPRLIKRLKLKHIHTLHDIQLIHPSGLMLYGKEKKVNKILTRFYSYICRILFSSPDVIISPSRWLFKMHIDRNFFTKSKKIILPNPLILDTTPLSVKKDKDIFRFLYVGQIEKHKGVFFLIRAFEMLCGENCSPRVEAGQKNHELIFIGSGSKIKQAKKMSKNNSPIKFLGKIKKKEVIKEMSNSDCLIVPSLCYENSPTVIYEAASIGLPVIVSDLGGIPELIHKLGGLLFSPKNESNLMHQMKWAMEHSSEIKKIGQKNRGRIKNYKLANYIKKLTNYI